MAWKSSMVVSVMTEVAKITEIEKMHQLRSVRNLHILQGTRFIQLISFWYNKFLLHLGHQSWCKAPTSLNFSCCSQSPIYQYHSIYTHEQELGQKEGHNRGSDVHHTMCNDQKTWSMPLTWFPRSQVGWSIIRTGVQTYSVIYLPSIRHAVHLLSVNTQYITIESLSRQTVKLPTQRNWLLLII